MIDTHHALIVSDFIDDQRIPQGAYTLLLWFWSPMMDFSALRSRIVAVGRTPSESQQGRADGLVRSETVEVLPSLFDLDLLAPLVVVLVEHILPDVHPVAHDLLRYVLREVVGDAPATD